MADKARFKDRSERGTVRRPLGLARPLQLALSPGVLASSFAVNILALVLPIVVLQVYDRVLPNAAVGTLLIMMGTLFVALVTDAVLRTMRTSISSWLAAGFEHQAGCRSIQSVLNADLAVLSRQPTGALIDRLQAIEALREFHAGQSATVIVDMPFVVLFAALMWCIAPTLAEVALVVFLAFGVVAIVLGIFVRRALAERRTADDRRFSFAVEMFGGAQAIKAWGAELLMQRRYERLMESAAPTTQRVSFLGNAAQTVGTLFSQVTMAALAAVGCELVLAGDLTLGALAATSLLGGRIIQPLMRAMGTWTQFQTIRLAERRLEELLSLPPEPGAERAAWAGTFGGLTLLDLQFAYGDKPVIDGVYLDVAPGEAVGITGASGSGKSTLLRLLAGALRPQGGEILVDGRELAGPRETIAPAIALIPSAVTIFQGTILDNLTMFRRGLVFDEALRLSRELGLDRFVSRLPQGYDTPLSGRGDDVLPAGVRQQIAVVRSLVSKPRIVLFDEGNSAFDREADDRLKALLLALKSSGTTLFLVSHRPSLMQIADRIYVLQNGRLHTPMAKPAPSRPASEPVTASISSSEAVA